MIDSLRKYLHDRVRIVSCNEDGLVAVEKPCGILSHPNDDYKVNTRAILNCRYDKNMQAYICDNIPVYLLNRLDSPVSGLMLLGLNDSIAEIVKCTFKSGNVKKVYVVLAKGFPRHMNGVWRSRLSKKIINGNLMVSCGSGDFAETRFQVLKSFRILGTTLSILKLMPITGRTHQLRVHCAKNGLPIVGDETYGDVSYNKFFRKNFSSSRLFLHSSSISVNYVINGINRMFCAKSEIDPFCELADHIDMSDIRH